MTVVEGRINQLAADFSGRLLQPGDADYDEARRIHNGLIDKRPALIARCRNAGDVARAILFAKENGLEIAVRGGGHNVAGRAVTEGGLMIDLAEMKGIEVDPEARTARAEGGVNWNEFNAATAEHGLAVTGGAISTRRRRRCARRSPPTACSPSTSARPSLTGTWQR
jgi:FAD/FMN-containing dehydrogenase